MDHPGASRHPSFSRRGLLSSGHLSYGRGQGEGRKICCKLDICSARSVIITELSRASRYESQNALRFRSLGGFMRKLVAILICAFICTAAGPEPAQHEEAGVPIMTAPYHLPVFSNAYVSVLKI